MHRARENRLKYFIHPFYFYVLKMEIMGNIISARYITTHIFIQCMAAEHTVRNLQICSKLKKKKFFHYNFLFSLYNFYKFILSVAIYKNLYIVQCVCDRPPRSDK